MIKAIETEYRGYRFRSRLEARWAVFFDDLGIKWQYENEGFDLGKLGRYLPDFFIEGNGKLGPYVEIKPVTPSDIEIRKMQAVCSEMEAYGLIIWGSPGGHSCIAFGKSGGIDQSRDRLVDEPWLECSPERFNTAINAAKSVRFEFDENKSERKAVK